MRLALLLLPVFLWGQAAPVVRTTTTQTISDKTLTLPIITSYTVAGLPGAPTTGQIAVVTDAATAGSCTSGGGSAIAYCYFNGTIWVPLGDGGGGGGGSPGGSGTELQYRSGASTFGGLENSSRPNAGELLITTTPSASGTRQVFGLGAALAAGSASGNYFGINAGSGFGGQLFRAELNGAQRLRLDSTGDLTVSGGLYAGVSGPVSGYEAYVKASSGNGDFAVVSGDNKVWTFSTIEGTGEFSFYDGAGAPFYIASGGANRTFNLNSTGKLGIGNPANLTYKLQVTPASQTTAGETLGVADMTASTGATRIMIQAGAGQSTTNLVEHRLTNATFGSGTLVGGITADGAPFSLPTASKPTCNSAARGVQWFFSGGAGVADTFEVCRKDAADVYAWVSLI